MAASKVHDWLQVVGMLGVHYQYEAGLLSEEHWQRNLEAIANDPKRLSGDRMTRDRK